MSYNRLGILKTHKNSAVYMLYSLDFTVFHLNNTAADLIVEKEDLSLATDALNTALKIIQLQTQLEGVDSRSDGAADGVVAELESTFAEANRLLGLMHQARAFEHLCSSPEHKKRLDPRNKTEAVLQNQIVAMNPSSNACEPTKNPMLLVMLDENSRDLWNSSAAIVYNKALVYLVQGGVENKEVALHLFTAAYELSESMSGATRRVLMTRKAILENIYDVYCALGEDLEERVFVGNEILRLEIKLLEYQKGAPAA